MPATFAFPMLVRTMYEKLDSDWDQRLTMESV